MLRGALLPILVLLMTATAAAQPLDIQGHRGARGHAPENTLAGFARALELGASTLELDVGVTRDGIVVIHHDRRLNPDLARGPDGRWVSAPAPLIADLGFAELSRYDVGRIRPGSEYARRFPHQKPIDGTRIPRLSDLFEAMKTNKSVRFNIETKLSFDAPDETLAPEPFARALIAEIRKAGLESRASVQSFDWRTLKVVEREAAGIATVYLTGSRNSDPEAVHAAGGRIWSPDFGELDAARAATAQRLGLRIIPWTVNEPADIRRMLALGVDGIISDYPDRVARAR